MFVRALQQLRALGEQRFALRAVRLDRPCHLGKIGGEILELVIGADVERCRRFAAGKPPGRVADAEDRPGEL